MRISVIAFLVLNILTFPAFGADFEPAACPDLNVKIYPGTGRWRVLHATSSTYMNSALGYDFVGLHSTGHLHNGKISGKNLLRMDMGLGKSAQLNFLMTVGAPGERSYFLVTGKSWIHGIQTVPLKVNECDEGTLCFSLPAEEGHRKQLTAIRIDMKTNTAEFVFAPGKKLPVEWNKDGFDLKGLPEETGKFRFVMPFSTNYRGNDGGITAVRRKIGTRFRIFPIYQTFYLESGK